MGWFNSKDEELKKRDWSASRATEIAPRPMYDRGTVEIHQRIDGRYRVEKDGFGKVVSVKKV